jgi:hypothetical protein
MADISEIVNVTISRETQAVTRAGFGVALFVDRNFLFTERVREYGSLAAMLGDGVVVGSPAYNAASLYFGQEISPTTLLLGRQVPTAMILTPTVQNTAAYTVVVGGAGVADQTITFTSDGTATQAEIATGLVALIEANGIIGSLVTTTDVSDTINIAQTGATLITVKSWSDNLIATYSSSETLVSAIQACRDERDDWYGIATYSHLEADILAVAAYIETVHRIYGYSTGAAGVITTGTTDVVAQLKALTRARSFGLYDSEAGSVAQPVATTTFGEMGWIGGLFPTDPGAATWMFKTISGIAPDNLTSTQSTNARNKNCNVYETIQGVNLVREGQMASGEYIDIIRGADWLEARMEERIFSRLVNLPKIPFTDHGVAIIESEVRAQLPLYLKYAMYPKMIEQIAFCLTLSLQQLCKAQSTQLQFKAL